MLLTVLWITVLLQNFVYKCADNCFKNNIIGLGLSDDEVTEERREVAVSFSVTSCDERCHHKQTKVF